jgi:Tuberculosis necrotizing toxin
VALFLVHIFPIGHLPVATDRPAMQLPAPADDVDYLAGQRFAPGDHPEAALVDAGDALKNVTNGFRKSPSPPPLAVPPALLEGHDPFGGLDGPDWNRRFLGGVRATVPEYAWPPGQLHPEGGQQIGEPVVVAEGVLLDRFGDETGRVFAPDGTRFASRSLPPGFLRAEYRRYRVLRALPLWRAVSSAWFSQPGGGVRYRATHPAGELVTMGYLAEITGAAERVGAAG